MNFIVGLGLLLFWIGCNAAEPRLDLDPCIEQAAEFHRVNAKTLKAIVFQESSGKPWKVGYNLNQTVDYGASGINSIHLPELSKFGITNRSLMDGCTNVYVGAWHYSKKIAKYGNTWDSVGAYHSETPSLRNEYGARIRRHLVNWGLLPMQIESSKSVSTAKIAINTLSHN